MCNVSLNGTQPSDASLRVLRALEAAGLEAWYVGGWVRDALMGCPSHDVDMCCSGLWQESKAALEAAGIAVVESGIKFGGITAISDGERIEVTTYRLDGFYTDGRHPQSVERAASLEDDLARRDFTVNAMAWHPERGLVDRYDGQGDLERKLIRAVGDPKRRFNEDALRMLRAVRFACRLDFMIEPETKRALAECAPLLDAVARERVGIELEGILSTGHGGDAMLRYPELICASVPELAAGRGFDQRSVYHAFNVYEHIARVLTVARACAVRRRRALVEPYVGGVFARCLQARVLYGRSRRQRTLHGHPELGAKKAHVIMDRLALCTTWCATLPAHQISRQAAPSAPACSI
ncbi:MAG: CCA tRNA nucleotidyltransferase [Collinsella sp.]